MSELIVRAREWIQEKRDEIQKLEDWIRQYEQSHQAIIGMVGEPETSATRVSSVAERSSSTSEVVAETEKILEEAGKPMSGAAILSELQNRGIMVSGKDPLNNLSTRLSLEAARPDGRIKSMGRGQGYVVAAVGTPPSSTSLQDLLKPKRVPLKDEDIGTDLV